MFLSLLLCSHNPSHLECLDNSLCPVTVVYPWKLNQVKSPINSVSRVSIFQMLCYSITFPRDTSLYLEMESSLKIGTVISLFNYPEFMEHISSKYLWLIFFSIFFFFWHLCPADYLHAWSWKSLHTKMSLSLILITAMLTESKK